MLPKEFNLNKLGLSIRLVDETDAAFITELRSDVTRTQYMLTLSPDAEAQKKWIQAYKVREYKGEDYYLMFLQNDRKIGVYRISHINYDQKIAKASSWIKVRTDRETTAKMFFLHKYIIFELLGLNFFYSDIHHENRRSLGYYRDFDFPIPEYTNERGYFDIKVSKEDYFRGRDKILKTYSFNL